MLHKQETHNLFVNLARAKIINCRLKNVGDDLRYFFSFFFFLHFLCMIFDEVIFKLISIKEITIMFNGINTGGCFQW